ncbi:hypothetical protein BU14_0033s0023 [Porphyra umbilicalis]|uniref:Uncharacterized protein n=1 Tax=Porphyra umbilicalis TaxID=2786 RepID=A0A1X6PIH5_PORUM|nr:hypothetical protein BU14_0033s0023 [Porphyra umbilicalis]|eukprot:OSX80679.1 hypothetical protein BU14_0033s0023 [Porphyra umbilicalis]
MAVHRLPYSSGYLAPPPGAPSAVHPAGWLAARGGGVGGCVAARAGPSPGQPPCRPAAGPAAVPPPAPARRTPPAGGDWSLPDKLVGGVPRGRTAQGTNGLDAGRAALVSPRRGAAPAAVCSSCRRTAVPACGRGRRPPHIPGEATLIRRSPTAGGRQPTPVRLWCSPTRSSHGPP